MGNVAEANDLQRPRYWYEVAQATLYQERVPIKLTVVIETRNVGLRSTFRLLAKILPALIWPEAHWSACGWSFEMVA